jgi:hypothetical protein
MDMEASRPDVESLGWKRSEKEAVIADAAPLLHLTLEERWDVFVSIQRMVGAAWAHLDEEEMRRRLEIGEKLDPRPDPWWKNIRPEGLP